jgi:heme O synthase-like polyprenyltransferase
MLAMLPRLKTTLPHQISSYLTLTKKRISNVFVKGIFGYLLRAPLRVDIYYQVSTSITGAFSFTSSLVVTSKSSCALTKGQKLEKKILHVP